MLGTSNAFKSAIKADIRRFKGRLTIKSTVYESDKISDFTYLSSCMAGETYSVGSTIASTLKIKLCLIVEGLKDLDPVKAEVGLVLPDGTTEWITLGQFLITKYDPNRNDLTTSIEAMDSFILMEGPYESKLSYPATIKAVATEIANLAGVKANASSFSKLSSTIKIDKPEGYTFRQAIGLIAQFEAGFARFNRQGELDIRGLEDPNYEVTPGEYFQKGLTKNEVMYRLGGISCKVKNDSDNKEKTLHVGYTTGTQISLENKVMRKELLDNIYSKLKTINFYPYSLDWRGNPALETGDWITVTDKKGTLFKVPNLTYELKFNGGLSAKSNADTRATSEQTYKSKGPLEQKFDDLEASLGDRINAANGKNIIHNGFDKPKNPQEGDIWFKPNGPDTELWVYEDDEWVMKVSTAFNPDWNEKIVISADQINAGTINAADVNIINLNVNSLVGNTTEFVKTAWNGINNSLKITGEGIESVRNDGTVSAKYLSDGIQIWGTNNKWIGSLSSAKGNNMVLWAKQGSELRIGYQPDEINSNIYETSLMVNGTTGEMEMRKKLIMKADIDVNGKGFLGTKWFDGSAHFNGKGDVNIHEGKTLWLDSFGPYSSTTTAYLELRGYSSGGIDLSLKGRDSSIYFHEDDIYFDGLGDVYIYDDKVLRVDFFGPISDYERNPLQLRQISSTSIGLGFKNNNSQIRFNDGYISLDGNISMTGGNVEIDRLYIYDGKSKYLTIKEAIQQWSK